MTGNEGYTRVMRALVRHQPNLAMIKYAADAEAGTSTGRIC